MLNHKLSRKAQLFLLGALLGVAIFLLVYGTAPLNVANDAFCRGGYIEKDIQQHYAGWLFYKRSAIGWPLGVTDAVNYPGGVSVAYTDSIPLLAALCRPLAAALGGTFQYFGWFTLVCFALQGGFGALLCSLFAGGLFAPLAGSLVFAASPVLIERAFRHTSLGAQWLVLAALYCYFVCKRQGLYASRGLFLLNVLAVGIHPYFLPMTYAVTLALLLEYAVQKRQWLRPAVYLGSGRPLGGAVHAPLPDRIAAATYAAALAAAGGDIRITSCDPALYGAFLQFLAQTGVQIEKGPDWAGLVHDPAVPLRGGVQLCADAWPAFATDTAPLAAAVLLAAEGKSEIFDRLFPNRFACAAGFAAMGAEVTAKGRRLMIAGGSRLRGAAVTAPDLRGGAALLVAALGADGTTTLRDPGHIRRGYADLPGEPAS